MNSNNNTKFNSNNDVNCSADMSENIQYKKAETYNAIKWLK